MVKRKKERIWDRIASKKKFSKKDYFNLTRAIMIIVAALMVVSFAVFFAIAYFSNGGIDKVFTYMLTANGIIYMLAFLFEFLSIFIRFFKWEYYMKVLGIDIPIFKNFMIYLSLYAMNLTPGKIGRVVSAYSINKVSKHKLFGLLPIVSFDIFTDFLGYVLLSLILVIIFPSYLPILIPIDVIMLLPFSFIISPWLFNIIKKKVFRGRFSEIFAFYGDEYFAAQSKLNNKKVYLISAIFTLPAAVMTSLSVYFTTQALGIHSDVLKSILIYVVSAMVGIASLIPGTIGSADLTMTTLIANNFNVVNTLSAAATIMIRVSTLWFGVILGTIFLFYTFRYWKK